MIRSQSNANHNIRAVSIHKATHNDAADIARLAVQLADYEQSHTLCDATAIEQLIASVREPVCHLLVAKSNDNVIGFILFYAGYDLSSDSYGFHLADVCVDGPYRNQGVGYALMQALAQQAQSESREWVSLTAIKHNQSAQRFYQKCGFEKVAVNFFAAGESTLRSWIKS